MIELTKDEARVYREALIESSKLDGGWVHIMYIPVDATDRVIYAPDFFIIRRATLIDARQRMGGTQPVLGIKCVGWAAAHQGLLTNGSDIHPDDYLAYALGMYKE